MKIRYGWMLDGSMWTAPSAQHDGTHAHTADIVTGPIGMAGVLATRLGLSHPVARQAERISHYRILMQRAAHPWYRESFEVDSWNTAKELLRYRDAAREAGWRPHEHEDEAPQRIEALRAIEHVAASAGHTEHAASLAPGLGDDLLDIRDALEHQVRHPDERWPLGIEAITADEDPASLPGLWPAIFDALAALGVQVRHAPQAMSAPVGVHMVEAQEEFTAAEIAAEQIAHHLASSSRPLVIIASRATIALDAQLIRRGLPPVSSAPASSHRLVTQVIALVIEALTPRLDIQALARMLAFDIPLEQGSARIIPGAAGRILVNAFASEAGLDLGNPASAFEQARESIRELDAANGTHHSVHVDRMVALLTPQAKDYWPHTRGVLDETRVRVDAINERLDFVHEQVSAWKWPASRAATTILTHIATLRGLLAVTAERTDPLDPATASINERDLRELITEAAPAERSVLGLTRAAPWTVVTEPAHIPTPRNPGEDAPAVVWWGAVDTPAEHASLWDPREVRALSHEGARVATPEAISALTFDARLRALRAAHRVYALIPSFADGEPRNPHPCLTFLAATGASDRATIHPHGEPLIQRDSADTVLERALANGSRQPTQAVIPSVPGNADRTFTPAPHHMPERMSYSQLQLLILDSFDWFLKYRARIREGGAAQVLTGNRMIGTLLHASVEDLARTHTRGGSVLTVTPAAARASIESLIPRYAAELHLPGRARLKAQVISLGGRTISTLFDALASRSITIQEIEAPLTHTNLELTLAHTRLNIELGGFIDMVARTPSARPVILDLKWTTQETAYFRRIAANQALQLATYAWALREDAGQEPIAGFFLLRQGLIVSAHAELTDTPVQLNADAVDPLDIDLDGSGIEPLSDTMSRAIVSAEARLNEIAAGTLTAHRANAALAALSRGVGEHDIIEEIIEAAERDGEYYERTSSGYSEYSVLSGVRGDYT